MNIRIATWNINSVRIRLDLLARLEREFQPDIICLQETKVQDEFFPKDEISKLGYRHMVYSGEKSYNGVAIISKKKIDDQFEISLCNNDKRHIAVKIGDFELHNFYIPAGGDEPDISINPKFKHKLNYLKEMDEWFAKNRLKNDKVILVGDLNIAPLEHDVWSSKQLKNVVSHTQVERESLMKIINGFEFIDTGRKFVDPNTKLYSWWSYRNKDWKKHNRGRRLDHIWVSKPLEHRLKNITCPPEIRDWDRPSDHIPFMIDLKI